MAKRTGLELFAMEFRKGFARMGGFRTWKTGEKLLADKIIDPNSKFRKAMRAYDITSTLKGSLKKAYRIIDLFIEEYQLEKRLVQKKWFLDADVKKIERKLQNIERLIRNEDDEFEYEACIAFWAEVKSEIVPSE